MASTHVRCASLLANKETRIFSAKRDETALLLFPFEAGLVDNKRLNQTCYTLQNDGNVPVAVGFEKTAGWLLLDKTIANAELGWHLVHKKDKSGIQKNPLWMKEIELAEFQLMRLRPSGKIRRFGMMALCQLAANVTAHVVESKQKRATSSDGR